MRTNPGINLVTPNNPSPLNNPSLDECNKKEGISLTSFSDGCLHVIPIQTKLLIDISIQTPYQGHEDYKLKVFTDKMCVNFNNSKSKNRIKLGTDALRSLTVDNAGGSSDYSEAVSIHYFDHVFNAKDFILETEVEYWREFKMVDYICTIYGERVGVSVTRAMGFPNSNMFSYEEAKHLLTKKINGLIVACDLVLNKHSFTKSILHVWCQNTRIRDLVYDVYQELFELDNITTEKFLCDVTVILTVCGEKDIYTNCSPKKNKILIIN